MSLDAITGSGNAAALRGADAVSRSGGVSSFLTSRPRFGPLDAFQNAGRTGSQRSWTATDQQSADTPPGASQARTAGDKGQSPTQVDTAFLAQSLAQEQDQAAASSSSQVSQIAAGLRAYARSVGAAPPGGDVNVEVIPPQLSSGHSLDLAV